MTTERSLDKAFEGRGQLRGALRAEVLAPDRSREFLPAPQRERQLISDLS
jgi:hypothetical protein